MPHGKKPEKAAAATKAQQQVEAPPKVAGTNGTPVHDPNFLKNIDEQLGARPDGKNVLLTIPIWGWTGDGKTCALLTAVHYSDQSQHPLVLAPVTNPNELTELESSTDEYKGLNLAGTAAATAARLDALAEAFIDNSEWPPGTDEPSAYILAIRSANATLGYALFPDIKGGSFREVDETARGVLSKAHAAALLVNPETYVEHTTKGKRYRNEILAQLHQFTTARVPVCVMITKADLFKEPHEAADRTERELTILLERQKGLTSLLCRVSVIGLGDESLKDSKPPPASQRHPEDLLKAWMWIVAQGLARPAPEIRNLIPPVNIRAAGERTANAVSMDTIAELRSIGDYSGSPGAVLCASSDDPRALAVTFVSNSGELLEAHLTSISGAQVPKFAAVGSIPNWEETASAVQAHYLGGEYIVGLRGRCNSVWQGPKGGPLTAIPLPSEMVAWTPVTSRRMVAVDAAGRLHSLRLDSGKWVQIEYLETFIAPSPVLACGLVERSSHAVVYNGSTVEGVAVGPDGHFGARVSPNLTVKYDSARTATNRLGLCLGMTKAGQVALSAADSPAALGSAKPDLDVPHVLAPYAPLAALVAPDLRLTAAFVRGEDVVETEDDHSPVLQTEPTNLVWTSGGELLVVSLDDDTWRVFRPLGLVQ